MNNYATCFLIGGRINNKKRHIKITNQFDGAFFEGRRGDGYRLGKRHGKTIIVNRQLLIANAFEYVIENHIPYTHAFIRRLYDKYGLPLSKYINTPLLSDITYWLMKPLEWFFLLVLYSTCVKPEEIINKQYSEYYRYRGIWRQGLCV